MSSKEKIKSHCNKCGPDKNHDVLYKDENSWSEVVDGQYHISGEDWYLLLKCCGCELPSMRHDSWFSEDFGPHDQIRRTKYYPPAIYKPIPEWLKKLDKPDKNYLYNLMKEIYSAIQNDSGILAVMGIRSALEHIMIDKIGDQRTFEGKLKKFLNEGFIASKQKDLLDIVLDAGHAVTHRKFSPNRQQVIAALEITESIVKTVYVDPVIVQELNGKVPPRVKTK